MRILPAVYFLIPFVMLAACNNNTRDTALLYQGEPVSAFCFAQGMGERVQAYPVHDCPEDLPGVTVSYQDLGAVGTARAVLIHESGGGSGQFSRLELLQRRDDRLYIHETVAAGDRCNGGIAAASVEDGRLAYSQHITAYDFIALSDFQSDVAVSAYDDLEACAACCYGQAHYVDDVLQKVSVDKTPGSQARRPALQNCFDEVLAAYPQMMAPAVLQDFAGDFHAQCLSE